MMKRKQSTKVDYDGRLYLTKRRRRRSFPFTGFAFVMICLWCTKAMIMVQDQAASSATAEIVLDVQRPVQTMQTLLTYPDPVTQWLATVIGPVLA